MNFKIFILFFMYLFHNQCFGQSKNDTTTEVILTSYNMAKFKVGTGLDFVKKIQNKTNAMNYSQKGRVIVSFLITQEGRIQDSYIEKGMNKQIDSTILSALNLENEILFYPVTDNYNKPVKQRLMLAIKIGE